MKKISQQRLCRSFACIAAFSVLAIGMIALVLGIYAVSSASWMSASFGKYANEIKVSSISFGVVLVLLSLLGCFGAFKRKKPCLWCFGLAVVLMLAIVAGGLGVAFETQSTLDRWQAQGYRLYASPPSGSNLSSTAEDQLHALFNQFGAIYAYCLPTVTSAAACLRSLEERTSPPLMPLSCRQTSSTSTTFAAWANSDCLASTRFAGAEGLALYAEIDACRADIAAAQATGAFEAVVAADVGDTAWLFCACARPLKTTIESEWLSPSYIVFASLCGYFTLLVLLLCCLCQGAAKAKKRKKKNDMELVILKQAAVEQGQRNHV